MYFTSVLFQSPAKKGLGRMPSAHPPSLCWPSRQLWAEGKGISLSYGCGPQQGRPLGIMATMHTPVPTPRGMAASLLCHQGQEETAMHCCLGLQQTPMCLRNAHGGGKSGPWQEFTHLCLAQLRKVGHIPTWENKSGQLLALTTEPWLKG